MPYASQQEFASSCHPAGSRLLVRQEKPAEKTKSGLYIGVNKNPLHRSFAYRGEVVAVGPGKTSEEDILLPMQVSVGDRILYNIYGGTEVPGLPREWPTFVILDERDVLAVIGDDE